MSTTETQLFEPDLDDATDRWEEFESSLDELPDESAGDGEDEFLSADIPVKSASVNLRSLHPELYSRLRKAFEDPRISSIARVSSGVRTYAQQVYLYKKFGRGRAANPDYRRADGRRGSNHMIQTSKYRYAGVFEPGEYGYAVDVGFWGANQWPLLRQVMQENGLRLTVMRPFEPWHFELDPGHGPSAFGFPAKGSGITDMQKLLAERHEELPNTIPDPGKPDGKFGPKTEAALTAWQTLLGIEADGEWGPVTERATAQWTQRRAATVREGSSGEDVSAVQAYLVERHAELPDEVPDPGKPDGKFGAKTQAAVIGWQTKLGITADGIWGPNTWTASDRYDDSKRSMD